MVKRIKQWLIHNKILVINTGDVWTLHQVKTSSLDKRAVSEELLHFSAFLKPLNIPSCTDCDLPPRVAMETLLWSRLFLSSSVISVTQRESKAGRKSWALIPVVVFFFLLVLQFPALWNEIYYLHFCSSYFSIPFIHSSYVNSLSWSACGGSGDNPRNTVYEAGIHPGRNVSTGQGTRALVHTYARCTSEPVLLPTCFFFFLKNSKKMHTWWEHSHKQDYTGDPGAVRR